MTTRRAQTMACLQSKGKRPVKPHRTLTVSLLQSQDIFERALVEIIEEHFDIAGYTLPD
jgi:hypothetical protein